MTGETQSAEPRTVILTGASRGIGHATVKRFSDEGWRIITCSRDAVPVECQRDPNWAHHIVADLADRASLEDFMAEHGIRMYSEHLSYCGDDGQLYDLMPIPFTDDAVRYVAKRVQRVQDILEQRIALENVSFYTPIDASMTEREFLLAVLEEADCDLMLDINNIVVNSINHRYDAAEFLHAMPAERIRYFHLAGHFVEAPGATGHLTVGGFVEEEWLDSGQCRDCFLPAFNHRPGSSVQAMLAARDPDAPPDRDRFRFGLIASSGIPFPLPI